MIKKILITALPVLFASSVYAVPNTFNAGETIVASKMNGNFSALEARIAVLEEQAGIGKTYQEKLTGTSYEGQFGYFGYFGPNSGGDIVSQGDRNAVRFLKGGGVASITLNADGTVVETGSEIEATGSTISQCDAWDSLGYCTSTSTDVNTSSDSWVGSGSTWSVNDTGVLTILWDGNDSDVFRVSEDGSIIYHIMLTNEIDEGDRMIENSIAIFVRQP